MQPSVTAVFEVSERRAWPRRVHAAACGGVLSLLCTQRSAQAIETAPLGDTPVSIDTTESISASYNADNRNTRRADVASAADDDWGLLSNRLETRASWQRWQLGLRVDSAWFWTSRSPNAIALEMLEQEHAGKLPSEFSTQDGEFFVQKFFQAGDELSDRFVNWNYPAKYSLSYNTPDFEATLGDFTAQFGRGLVLSVRKEDQLSGDTTIRGARAAFTFRHDDLRLKLTGLGGSLNPLRIDDATGRVLGTTRAVRGGIGSVTEAAMPRAVDSAFTPTPRANYAPDSIVGAEVEARSRPVGLSLAGVHLSRACQAGATGCTTLASDLVRAAQSVENLGASVNFPDLWHHGALYVEAAHQILHDFADEGIDATSGNALYANLTLFEGPVTVSLDAKHYRNYYPLKANIDIGHAREFAGVQYSALPTTLPVWNDTEYEGFNSCVTGGRARADWQTGAQHGLYGWVGRYDTWSESVAATGCEPKRENVNHVWDFAQGAQLFSKDRQTRADASLGARFDAMEREVADAAGSLTDVFYRELYTRYDVTVALGHDLALEFQGWHRRRRQTLGGPVQPWLQGTTVSALQWGPRLNLAFGFEYDQNPAFPGTYFNGQVRYDLGGSDGLFAWAHGPSTLSVFAGQRQGGMRCVSGVCRVYAPFEGARLDLTVAF